jgi:hypothetical protein
MRWSAIGAKVPAAPSAPSAPSAPGAPCGADAAWYSRIQVTSTVPIDAGGGRAVGPGAAGQGRAVVDPDERAAQLVHRVGVGGARPGAGRRHPHAVLGRIGLRAHQHPRRRRIGVTPSIAVRPLSPWLPTVAQAHSTSGRRPEPEAASSALNRPRASSLQVAGADLPSAIVLSPRSSPSSTGSRVLLSQVATSVSAVGEDSIGAMPLVMGYLWMQTSMARKGCMLLCAPPPPLVPVVVADDEPPPSPKLLDPVSDQRVIGCVCAGISGRVRMCVSSPPLSPTARAVAPE